jgi:hypothetical protein
VVVNKILLLKFFLCRPNGFVKIYLPEISSGRMEFKIKANSPIVLPCDHGWGIPQVPGNQTPVQVLTYPHLSSRTICGTVILVSSKGNSAMVDTSFSTEGFIGGGIIIMTTPFFLHVK